MRSSPAIAKPRPPVLATGDRYIDVQEAADVLRVSVISVRRYLSKGVLRRYKANGRTLVKLGDVLELIRPA